MSKKEIWPLFPQASIGESFIHRIATVLRLMTRCSKQPRHRAVSFLWGSEQVQFITLGNTCGFSTFFCGRSLPLHCRRNSCFPHHSPIFHVSVQISKMKMFLEHANSVPGFWTNKYRNKRVFKSEQPYSLQHTSFTEGFGKEVKFDSR